MIPVYDVGDRRRLQCTIVDEDDELTDPTTLTFTMLEPDGTVTEYVWSIDSELIRTTQGTFYVNWDAAQVGVHRWRYEATGNVQQVEEAAFTCRRSQVVTPP